MDLCTFNEFYFYQSLTYIYKPTRIFYDQHNKLKQAKLYFTILRKKKCINCHKNFPNNNIIYVICQ